MSRLIVKNLPKNITKEELKEHFAQKGHVTDVKLHFTKKGVFRRFAFVGYRTEEEGKAALSYFNKSFIKTSKIVVDTAWNYGESDGSRPWSKYSSTSSAFQRFNKEKEERMQRILALQDPSATKEASTQESSGAKSKKTANKQASVLQELDAGEQDPEFREFLKAHQSSQLKQTWGDDMLLDKGESAEDAVTSSGEEKRSKGEVTKPSPNTAKSEVAEDDSDEESGFSDDENTDKEATGRGKGGTDLDWLQTKISTAKPQKENSSDDESEDSSGSEDSSSEDESKDAVKIVGGKSEANVTVKLRGLPFKATEEEIIKFLAPVRVLDIRLLKNKDGRPSGAAYVDLCNASDVKTALKKDGGYLGKRYIEVTEPKSATPEEQSKSDTSRKWEKFGGTISSDKEPISESGRLFVRNLPYTCTEEELGALFEKFGPLAEVHLPLDKETKANVGIGFVTFMLPEHGVLAYNNLDGKVFQGRLLHILPGEAKREIKEDVTTGSGGSSFKQQKEKKLKATSSSSHNWNTLFLGANAVADVIANRLKTSKSHVLSSDTKDSLAVRMALGETQIVSETREFLVAQGVQLDVFGQADAKRSKTVLLAKNLPSETSETELINTFSKYGEVLRIVLPPFGITSLIEFARPSEAKEAFQNLAYSKFKHAPLYLEWAPLNVFSGKPDKKGDTLPKDSEGIEDKEAQKGKDTEFDKDDSLDVNDACVLFVKNLNFETTEEGLKKKLSSAGFTTHVTVAKKKDAKKPTQMLSMGYGFVEFANSDEANKALIKLQHCELDGHRLEFKRSNKPATGVFITRQKAVENAATGSKILVRNIPFEATEKEVKELFGAFGELKLIRVPKKVSGTGSHRGFAFVEFLTKQDAKRAFNSLCQSTHLYGRRLVLEWAENDETVDSIRKRTIQHYHKDNKIKKKKQEFIDDIERAALDE